MSLLKIFDTVGSGMSAQSLRLNTTASNLSNAEVVAGSEKEVYRARYPVFSAVQQQVESEFSAADVGVKVDGIIESSAPIRKEYQPHHALADQDGYVYLPNVNVISEMANMISASRSYQMNVQVLSTAKQLMLKTLQLGQ